MTIFISSRLCLLLVLCAAAARMTASQATSGRAPCAFRMIAGFLDVLDTEWELSAGGTLYNTTRPMLEYHRIHRFLNLTMFTGQYKFPVRLSLYLLEASVDAAGTWRVRALNQKPLTSSSDGSCNGSSIALRIDWNASHVYSKSSSTRMTDATFEPLVAAESRVICGEPLALGGSTNCGVVDEKALALAIGELFVPPNSINSIASTTNPINPIANSSSSTKEAAGSSLFIRSRNSSAAPVPIFSEVVGNLSVNAKVLSRSFVTSGVQLAALLHVGNESVRAHSTLLNLV